MPTERNDPCPCGSRRKYKKCCGAELPPRIFQIRFESGIGVRVLVNMAQFRASGGDMQHFTFQWEGKPTTEVLPQYKAWMLTTVLPTVAAEMPGKVMWVVRTKPHQLETWVVEPGCAPVQRRSTALP